MHSTVLSTVIFGDGDAILDPDLECFSLTLSPFLSRDLQILVSVISRSSRRFFHSFIRHENEMCEIYNEEDAEIILSSNFQKKTASYAPDVTVFIDSYL